MDRTNDGQFVMNVSDFLANSVSKYPERTALVYLGRRWTYRELGDRVKRLAGAMAAKDIKKGDRVAVMFYNSNHFVEIYFAALQIGAVVTPINFRFVGTEVAYIVNDSGASALFYDAEFHDTITPVRHTFDRVKWFVATGDPDPGRVDDYDALLAGACDKVPCSDVNEDDPCQLMYTSGTTGRPKGALITHRAVMWNLVNIMFGREDQEGERALIIGPLYHTAALNNHLTIQIALGGASILIRRFHPEHVLEVIEQERATTISGSPAMYNLLLQHPEARNHDVSSITKCTAGAAILPLETKRRIEKFFSNVKGIYDVYGCTEASPVISVLRGVDSVRKEGSVGRAMPFVDVRIVDDSDNLLPPGGVGELVCRGPNVMLGYHGRDEETRETLRGGWLHTGDVAWMDEEGYLYIIDRKKDMIISGGENIYPREIEEVLLSHPAILDAAVVGFQDPLWGESVRAFVVPASENPLTEEMVVVHCRQHLASYKKPKIVSFVKEIPRNPSGKILKTKLREIKVASNGIF
jgi:fatty-acyl-CoA synthase